MDDQLDNVFMYSAYTDVYSNDISVDEMAAIIRKRDDQLYKKMMLMQIPVFPIPMSYFNQCFVKFIKISEVPSMAKLCIVFVYAGKAEVMNKGEVVELKDKEEALEWVVSQGFLEN